jgi:hypothetical protein
MSLGIARVINAGRAAGLAARRAMWPIDVAADVWRAARADSVFHEHDVWVLPFCVLVCSTPVVAIELLVRLLLPIDKSTCIVPCRFIMMAWFCVRTITWLVVVYLWGCAIGCTFNVHSGIRRLWERTVQTAWPGLAYDACIAQWRADLVLVLKVRALLVAYASVSTLFIVLFARQSMQVTWCTVMATVCCILIAALAFYHQCVVPLRPIVALFVGAVADGAGGAQPNLRDIDPPKSCVICLERPPTVVFLCGAVVHRCVCSECHRAHPSTDCPLCRHRLDPKRNYPLIN